MIAIIRIKGQVGLKKQIAETLNRLRIRKKYSCVVFPKPTKEQLGMIKKVKDFVAFGEINKETYKKLIEKRGQLIKNAHKSKISSATKSKEQKDFVGKKIDAKKVIEGLEKGKKYEELNLKPFFRLHPPRKGINSKLHFPKGVLGNNKEKINELIERML